MNIYDILPEHDIIAIRERRNRSYSYRKTTNKLDGMSPEQLKEFILGIEGKADETE